MKAGLQAGSNTAAAFNAGVNSIATQGVMVAVGLQEKFSWKSVAASAVSAAVSNVGTKRRYQVLQNDIQYQSVYDTRSR